MREIGVYLSPVREEIEIPGVRDHRSCFQNAAKKQTLTLYVACMIADAAVERDATRIQPYATPVAVNDTQCTKSAG
jgi:hypothetical protein